MPTDPIDLSKGYDPKIYGSVISKNPYSDVTPFLTNDKSQYDEGFILPTQGADPFTELQEYRAQQQPGIDQLANGLVKGAVLAGTTFADTFGGTLSGVLNMALNGSEQGYLNAFVNNPFSNAMQDINDASEKAFANYRTRAEQEMGVFEQMGTANFWGDMFIKNLGFAGGAMAAGYVSGALFSGLTQGVRARQEAELFKKMTKNVITKDAKSVEEGIQMLANAERTGLLNVEAAELKQLLEDSGKAYRNLNRANQLTSSALAATGEARIEALGNGRQFQEAKLQELNAEFKNPDGTFKAGKTQEEYNNKLNQLDDLVKGFQNSEFLINTALLTASNFIGYRNFFAKDYGLNAGRFDDLISINSIKNITAGEDIAKLIQSKWYSTLGKSLMGSGREGLEEFFQTVTQKSADNYYSAKFNGIDPDAFTSLAAGMNEAMGKEGLESFILGAMTGLIMPGGGLISEFKQAKQLNKDAAERVADLNNSVKAYVEQYKTNPESVFMNFYDMINRDVNLNKAQLKALLDDDKYTYENLKNDKFYNMASAFINAGKYNDLVDILEEETKLSADDLRVKYSVPTDPANPNSPKKEFFKNWEDHEIKTYIANQSKKNTNAVKNIRDLMNNIESRYGKQLALIKTEDGTKKVEIKNILARHLFLGETLDRRLTGVHNELLKMFADAEPANVLDTTDGFAITDFINNASRQLEEVNDENFKKILKNFEKVAKNSSDPKKMVELFTDYIQLAGDRKAHNAAWIRLTENSFTNLLNRLQTEDQKQAEKNIEQTNKELNDEEKINIVREKAKAAGYSKVGNYFTITDNNGNVKKYELDPIDIFNERKKLQEEFNNNLSQLDPNDTEAIKALEEDYAFKKDDLVNKANQALVKDFETGEYLKENNQYVKFNKEFALKNYNKIQFIPREQAVSIKRSKVIQNSNRRKIEAIRQVLLELNKDINPNIARIDALNNEKSQLENDINYYKQYLSSLNNETGINFVNTILKRLNDRLEKVNTALEDINRTTSILVKQKENLITLGLEIKEAFEKSEGFSIEEFIKKMDELNVESADKIRARNLAKDLQELADTTEIDNALYDLSVLKNNLEAEVERITKTISDLEEALLLSEAFKEKILASKIEGLPEWFTDKWNIPKGSAVDKYISKYDDLRDLRKLNAFKILMYRYAKANGINPKEAYQEYLNDLNQLKQETNNFNNSLNRNFQEIESIQKQLLVNKSDLANLKNTIADVIDVMEFNKKRSLVNTIQKNLNQIKIKYSNIVNKETKNLQLVDNQIGSDAPPIDDVTEEDNIELGTSKSAKSNNLFYTTNKTILQKSNGETDYDSEGYPKTNPNNDAVRWNTFLERNPDLSKNFALQAFILQDLPDDSPLKIAALERIKQGGDTPSATDIITALVDTKTDELVKASIDGIQNGEVGQGLVYTFLPLTSSLLEGNPKVNGPALFTYFNNFGLKDLGYNPINLQSSIMNLDKSHDGDLIELTRKDGTKLKITLAEFKNMTLEYAKNKHIEFINTIITSSRSGKKVFLPIKGVTNGILLKKESVDGSNVMQPVRNILADRRNIDTSTDTGLDNVKIFVVDKKVDQYKIPGTNIIIDNPKLGATIIYNAKTKEYFYANQRNINDDEVDLIFHLLEMIANNPEKNLNMQVKIGGQDNRFYIGANGDRISEIDIFRKQGTISLMNNLIYWGGKPKTEATKHTIYIDKGKIFYPNPNNNFALESISLSDIRNIGKNKNLQAYLKTKRFNVNTNMMKNTGLYFHPVLKNGKLDWVAFKGGYKDMLLNGNVKMDPVLITSAIDSNNSNYKGNKLLFASKNIILDINNDGIPSIMNDYKKQQPAKSPIIAPIVAGTYTTTTTSQPIAEPVFTDKQGLPQNLEDVEVTDEFLDENAVTIGKSGKLTFVPGVTNEPIFSETPLITKTPPSDTNQGVQPEVVEEKTDELQKQCDNNVSNTPTQTATPTQTPTETSSKFGKNNNPLGITKI